MKRILSLLVALCLLFGAAAFAEDDYAEEEIEEAVPTLEDFKWGIQSLLDSFSPERDMLTASLNVSGQELFQGGLKVQTGEAPLAEAAALIQGQEIKLQFTQEEAWLDVGGAVLNLRFEDLQEIAQGLAGSAGGGADMSAAVQGLAQLDGEIVQEIGQLFLTKVLLPGVTYTGGEDGSVLVYDATGAQLLSGLAEFVDAVLADERYDQTLETILTVAGSVSQMEMPTLDQIRELWPEYKENMVNAETDFAAHLEVSVSGYGSAVTVTGEIGVPADKYTADIAFRRGEDRTSLSAVLAEILQRGEAVHSYEITADFESAGDEDNHAWQLNLEYPSQGLSVAAEGSHTYDMGSVYLFVNNRYNMARSFMGQLSYSQTYDGLLIDANVRVGRNSPVAVSALLGEDNMSVRAIDFLGRKLFALNLLSDGWSGLIRASVEVGGDRPFGLLWDREKVVLTYAEGESLVFTGAVESENAYVITIHRKGKNVPEDAEDTYVRVEYSGEPGDYVVSARAIGPGGQEAGALTLTCSPTQPIESLLSESENILYLTPETVQALLTQLTSQY